MKGSKIISVILELFIVLNRQNYNVITVNGWIKFKKINEKISFFTKKWIKTLSTKMEDFLGKTSNY